MNPIGALVPHAVGTAAAPETSAAPDPGLLKAAKEFESIFVRQMLKSVEKTTAAGCGTKAAPGQSTYGSMIVDTLSDSISKGGGLGLSDVIARSMIASHPSLTKPSAAAGTAAPSTKPLVPNLKPLK